VKRFLITTARFHRRQAFSLVEILIVIMIIGILAAIAIPKLANASQLTKENATKADLRLLRGQIGVYKSQHDVNPGYPHGDLAQPPTAATAFAQLLQYTDMAGNTSATGSATYKWGPYFIQIPVNPVNGNSDWKILSPSDPFTADGTTGWMYEPLSGAIKANVVGNDSAGHAYTDY